ncbi:MAG: hypothetical protein Phog2KO_35760 [Phototrophicaceae bacterium]
MSDLQVDTERILQDAEALFESEGFEQVSLQDIADTSGLPLDVIKQAYPTTAHIALSIYHHLADESLQALDCLEDGKISERYFMVMENKLAQLTQHQESVSALFAIAMRPKSGILPSEISPGLRDPMMSVMQDVVRHATDSPAKDNDDMTFLLYAFHFLVIIFWLYDRTEDKEASHLFTNFLREFVKISRPMMVMPMFTRALNKMAQIMMVVFGGARLVDEGN